MPTRNAQGLVEYAMILVAVLVIAVPFLIGPQVGHIFSNVVMLV
ncbi:MAG: pilus assembly protein [Anaerolineae bacterium]|nr:pilus assembly protein [Anaerolineae bacterium]